MIIASKNFEQAGETSWSEGLWSKRGSVALTGLPGFVLQQAQQVSLHNLCSVGFCYLSNVYIRSVMGIGDAFHVKDEMQSVHCGVL